MPTSKTAEIIPLLSAWKNSRTVQKISLPTPPIGGKAWVLSCKGVFVLEAGPGVLRTVACTHIGSGSISIHNGVPDEEGNFPYHVNDGEEYNGRPLFRANPVVMGSWMMDAGFVTGLTLRATGGSEHTSPVATIVWMPHGKR